MQKNNLRVSCEDIHKGAFSGATGAHDGRQLPRRKKTTHALEYRLGFCNNRHKKGLMVPFCVTLFYEKKRGAKY